MTNTVNPSNVHHHTSSIPTQSYKVIFQPLHSLVHSQEKCAIGHVLKYVHGSAAHNREYTKIVQMP